PFQISLFECVRVAIAATGSAMVDQLRTQFRRTPTDISWERRFYCVRRATLRPRCRAYLPRGAKICHQHERSYPMRMRLYGDKEEQALPRAWRRPCVLSCC